MEAWKKIYNGAYIAIWTAAGLLVSFLSAAVSGDVSWAVTKEAFYDFGIIGLYAGVIGSLAPHTREDGKATNFVLAAIFWYLSKAGFLLRFVTDDPEAATYLLALFGVWLVYIKIRPILAKMNKK